MLRIILLLVCFAIGVGGGGFTVMQLFPPVDDAAIMAAPIPEAGTLPDGDVEYVRLPRQITVPVWRNDEVRRMVAVELTLVVDAGTQATAVAVEPRLRAKLLSRLVEVANTTDLKTTNVEAIDALSVALRDAAQSALPGKVHEVLITDLFVQEL